MVRKNTFSLPSIYASYPANERSANTADQEKRSYSDLAAVDSRGSLILTERQLRGDLQRWLAAPDPSTNHNFARKAHHKGTASWFFQGSIFEQWKSSPSLLWIHGKRMSPLLVTTPRPSDSYL
jgi:hypothetical protein